MRGMDRDYVKAIVRPLSGLLLLFLSALFRKEVRESRNWICIRNYGQGVSPITVCDGHLFRMRI